MTERLKGLYVTFEKDIREDDAEYISNAIRMIKGVTSVNGIIVNAEDEMNRERIRLEFKRRMYEALEQL
ncbi:hypothetical protein WKH57_01360 [Niallia taxi]|uniref:hypothetical protein n=1 Tax=Niallia taxi TaxID=2499688 RepID=UPI0031766116